MMEWRSDMENAPKDGTPILVWFNGRMHVAEFGPIWHSDNKKWFVREPETFANRHATVTDISPRTWNDGTPMEGSHPGPTHWMPLPSPPEPPQ